jgi:hypothetical protein
MDELLLAARGVLRESLEQEALESGIHDRWRPIRTALISKSKAGFPCDPDVEGRISFPDVDVLVAGIRDSIVLALKVTCSSDLVSRSFFFGALVGAAVFPGDVEAQLFRDPSTFAVVRSGFGNPPVPLPPPLGAFPVPELWFKKVRAQWGEFRFGASFPARVEKMLARAEELETVSKPL